MKERWVLYYDGACPFCTRAKSKITKLLPDVKLTSVDLNSEIAHSKGYDKNSVVLETPEKTYKGHYAWLKIIEQTNFKWATNIFCRPLFIVFYVIVSKNRKLMSKML